jgi:hypothetical protein
MALIEINRNPSPRDLRWFGLIVALFCAVVGAVLWWRFDLPAAGRVAALVGLVLMAAYYALPPIRRAMYVGWMYLFFPLGFVLAHVVLAIIYFLVLTPVGLVMRLFRRDPMQRSLDRDADTYWEARDPNVPPERYFRQY